MEGTLIDSLAAIVDASVEAFAGSRFETPSPAQVREVVGLHLELCVEHWAPQASPEEVRELAERYRQAFRGQRARGDQNVRPYDGVDETLSALTDDEVFMAASCHATPGWVKRSAPLRTLMAEARSLE